MSGLCMNKAISSKVKVEIYSTALCPYCLRAISLLESKAVEYIEYNVDRDPGLRDEMERRSQRTSVPQIFISDRHIGGFDDMYDLEVEKKLDEILGLGLGLD